MKCNEETGLVVMIWTCILEVSSLSLDRLLASMSEGFHGCSQSLNSDAGIVNQNKSYHDH